MEDTSLNDWFMRPRLIYSEPWAEGADYEQTFNPWDLYFGAASVAKKLHGYSRLRADLNIKVVINASPFQYGMTRLSYRPLVSTGSSSYFFNFSGGEISPLVSRESKMVAKSQRPGFNIVAQTCQGGTMVLPFIYPDNWVDLSDAGISDHLKAIGQINMASFSPLRTSASSPGTSVEISVFAWASNVKLAGPSIALSDYPYVVQSKDEYDEKPVSKVASAISKATGALGTIPIIGPYMMATSAFMGAASRLASYFGYTNVPIIKTLQPVRVAQMPNFANTQIGSNYEMLAMDPKNQLTVDPRTVGSSPEDELGIVSLCTRSSYIATTLWYDTDPQLALLGAIAISPDMFNNTTLVGVNGLDYLCHQSTPMAHVATMFNNWRGDIKVTLRVMASAFHRGRLRVVFDPIKYGVTDPIYQINEIVDLCSDTEFSFVVPYMGVTSWKSCPTNSQYDGGQTFFGDRAVPTTALDERFNGILKVEVLNVLTSPIVNAPAVLNWFVEAMPNIEFSEPRPVQNKTISPYSYYELQSLEVESTTRDVGSHEDNNRNLVFMGEAVTSMRDLMHRTTNLMTYTTDTTNDNSWSLFRMSVIMPRFPRYPGPSPTGAHFAVNELYPTPYRYNFANYTPVNWMAQCFTGHRGSMAWRVAPLQYRVGDTSKILSNTVTRLNGNVAYYTYNAFLELVVNLTTRASPSQFARSMITTAFYPLIRNEPCTLWGSSMCLPPFDPVVNVTAPMYSKHRMLPANPLAGMDPGAPSWNNDYNKDNLVAECVYGDDSQAANNRSPPWINTYVHAGTDFALFQFLNIPTLYSIPSGILPDAENN